MWIFFRYRIALISSVKICARVAPMFWDGRRVRFSKPAGADQIQMRIRVRSFLDRPKVSRRRRWRRQRYAPLSRLSQLFTRSTVASLHRGTPLHRRRPYDVHASYIRPRVERDDNWHQLISIVIRRRRGRVESALRASTRIKRSRESIEVWRTSS